MPIISESWDKVLKNELEQPYLNKIQDRLKADLKQDLQICPSIDQIFNAYKLTPFNSVKVVILSDEPYYTDNADGLAFSSTYVNPILSIMFNELKGSTGQIRTNPNLEDWANQGVFLLSTILTTIKGQKLAHRNIGWEKFTTYTLQQLSSRSSPMVVMLWGKYATSYGSVIDGNRNLILKAPHPASDVGSNNQFTFRGCQHFSMCNDFLESNNITPINWGD